MSDVDLGVDPREGFPGDEGPEAELESSPPQPIPEAAIWRGEPNRYLIHIIQSMTHMDAIGRRYWRPDCRAGWRRLNGPYDYAALNRAIDAKRAACLAYQERCNEV